MDGDCGCNLVVYPADAQRKGCATLLQCVHVLFALAGGTPGAVGAIGIPFGLGVSKEAVVRGDMIISSSAS